MTQTHHNLLPPPTHTHTLLWETYGMSGICLAVDNLVEFLSHLSVCVTLCESAALLLLLGMWLYLFISIHIKCTIGQYGQLPLLQDLYNYLDAIRNNYEYVYYCVWLKVNGHAVLKAGHKIQLPQLSIKQPGQPFPLFSPLYANKPNHLLASVLH